MGDHFNSSCCCFQTCRLILWLDSGGGEAGEGGGTFWMRNSPRQPLLLRVGPVLHHLLKRKLISTFIFISSGSSDFYIISSVLKSCRSLPILRRNYFWSLATISLTHTLNSETMLQKCCLKCDFSILKKKKPKKCIVSTVAIITAASFKGDYFD